MKVSASMLALVAAIGASEANGYVGYCYSIIDPDQRAMCRAKEHHEPGYCYSIQQSDLRAQCLAETPRK
ncbi:hypothetical protein NLZ15_22690 (plasmid) [Atlantibacter subterranea]|uniref:hypothetical protein n=1 Tax=Atlantibacter subterraneus TaxID=255519 RepID=UPI0020C1ED93|nr:hypothetical protein [Atlantibacter subterranea]UTJ49783.1 hypothetical protein NLZ15_22690 [Atlantibacter subterranea]